MDMKEGSLNLNLPYFNLVLLCELMRFFFKVGAVILVPNSEGKSRTRKDIQVL
jgi:hypothetical protein